MQIKRHIPSLFTLINLFLGFLAIISIFHNEFVKAAWLIMAAGVMDSVDGKLARKFGIASDFGTEIDSLADMVSFCLAPSVMVYGMFTKNYPGVSGEIFAAIPLMMGAVRLARFNTKANTPSDFFEGIPTPISAFAISALTLFSIDNQNATPEYTQAKFILPVILVVSFLMVSKVHFAKFPALSFKVSGANTMKLVIILIIPLTTLLAHLYFEKESMVLLFWIAVYISIGFLKHFLFKDDASKEHS